MQNQSAIIDLIKLTNDTEKLPHLLVQATADSINKGTLENGKIGPTQNSMFSDDNILVDIWVHLKPALDYSIEALSVLLGNPEFHLFRSLLSMEKCFNTKFPYLHTQLGVYINTRNIYLRIPDTKRK